MAMQDIGVLKRSPSRPRRHPMDQNETSGVLVFIDRKFGRVVAMRPGAANFDHNRLCGIEQDEAYRG